MKKLLILGLYLLNLAILVWAWWSFNIQGVPKISTSLWLLNFGKLFGIIATYQALVQLVLIGRVKWVEQIFGLDKLSKIHKLNGYTVLGFIVGHIFWVTQAYSIFNKIGFINQYFYFLYQWDDVFKAALGFWIILGTIILSITIVRKRLKYEWWYWVHLFNYLAYILFVGHQLEYGLSAQSEWFKIYWLGLYIFAFGNIGLFRFILPLYRFYKYDFKVAKVVLENKGLATSIYIGGKNLERYKRKAGQFFIFRFLQKGFWYEAHPFSLSTSPQADQIRITAKNLGDFTAKLPNIKPGTKVLIDGPHGIFTQQVAKTDKFLLLAGGIGITPLRSLAEDLSKQGKDVILIYGAKNEKEIILREELEALSKQYNNFKFYSCLSDEQHKDHLYGYIDAKLIQQQVPDFLKRDVYLCGPPIMMDKLKVALLKELKLPKKQFHWERFAL